MREMHGSAVAAKGMTGRQWTANVGKAGDALDRPLLLLCIAAVLTGSVIAYRSGHVPDDLAVYWGAVDSWRSGGDLYAFHRPNGDGFTYPPGAAIVLIWIRCLSPAALAGVWVLLSGGALWLCSVSVHRYSQVPTGVAFALFLFSAAGRSNVMFGQVSVFIFALCLVDCCLVPARHRGYLTGIAAAIKVTPALFIVYFLARREWGNALRSLAGAAALTLAGAVSMPAETLQYIRTGLVSVSSVSDWDSVGNQSLRAVLARMSLPGYATISVVLGLAMIISVFAFIRTAKPRRLEGWVLVGLLTIVVSPISWTHHRLWLTVPLLMPWLWRGVFGASAWCLMAIASLVGSAGDSVWTWPVRELGFVSTVLMVLLICWNVYTYPVDDTQKLLSEA